VAADSRTDLCQERDNLMTHKPNATPATCRPGPIGTGRLSKPKVGARQTYRRRPVEVGRVVLGSLERDPGERETARVWTLVKDAPHVAGG
jgi:hypothetical protein